MPLGNKLIYHIIGIGVAFYFLKSYYSGVTHFLDFWDKKIPACTVLRPVQEKKEELLFKSSEWHVELAIWREHLLFKKNDLE